MGWASKYIEALQSGRDVQFRPVGGSMRGRVESGQLCTVRPAAGQMIEVDDVVLCRVGRFEYLHLIKAIDGERYQIGNNRGGINGWVARSNIFGKLVKVER